MRRVFMFAVLFCTMPPAALCHWEHQRESSTSRRVRQIGKAQDIFARACGSCHGRDGKGGLRVASRVETVSKSDQELLRILNGAKAITGMASCKGLGSKTLAALVPYVRTLQGKPQHSALPGDSERGRSFFFGKAKCSGCHSVHGQGGFPSLTYRGATAIPADYDSSLTAEELDDLESFLIGTPRSENAKQSPQFSEGDNDN